MARHNKHHNYDPDLLNPDVIHLPNELNEDSVARHLTMVSRSHPQQLPGIVRAIRERWAHNRATWVEEARTVYLDAVLGQLKLSNEILRQCVEQQNILSAHRRQRENEQAESEQGLPGLEAQAQAEDLKVRIEESRAKQAEARKKRYDIENPPGQTQKREMTTEERRRENLQNAEDKVERLRKRKESRLAEILRGRRFDQLSSDEQEEYRADENMYSDRILRAKEERAQYE